MPKIPPLRIEIIPTVFLPMGFLYFCIGARRYLQIPLFLSKILHQLKLIAIHLGLLKPAPETDWPPERPSSYVFVTGGPCPSVVTVPAKDLNAMLKKRLPVIEYGEFVEKLRSEKKEEEDGKIRCAICLNGMERWEKMRELMNCGHVFHRECLDTWVDELQITCPLCRSLLLPPAGGDADGIPCLQ